MLHPSEEATTTYTCATSYCYYYMLLQNWDQATRTLGPVSLEMPHRLVHIPVTAFDDSRGSGTAFGNFRVFMLARPNTRHEDRTEAYGQHSGSKDLAGLTRGWLWPESLDDHRQGQADPKQASAQVGDGSQVSGADGSGADDIQVRRSERDRYLLEESDCERESALLNGSQVHVGPENCANGPRSQSDPRWVQFTWVASITPW